MSVENFGDIAKLYQVTVMLLSGRAKQPVDVLFFHNRSFGDYTNLYEMAGEMFKRGRVGFIAVTNNEGERFGSTVPYAANPGMTEHIRRLTEEQQIPPENILHPETRAFHTRQENDAFLELSKQMVWRSGVILAQPHQIIRPMLGMLQAMDVGGYQMEIYTAAPEVTPWLEVVRGNQGIELKPRIEHISDELERIYRYQTSGELATFEQLFDYLKAREERSLILDPMERGSKKLTGHLPPSYQSGLV